MIATRSTKLCVDTEKVGFKPCLGVSEPFCVLSEQRLFGFFDGASLLTPHRAVLSYAGKWVMKYCCPSSARRDRRSTDQYSASWCSAASGASQIGRASCRERV